MRLHCDVGSEHTTCSTWREPSPLVKGQSLKHLRSHSKPQHIVNCGVPTEHAKPFVSIEIKWLNYGKQRLFTTSLPSPPTQLSHQCVSFLERQVLKVAAPVAGLSFIQKQNINNNKKEIIKEFQPKIKAELPTISETVLTHFYILYYVFMRSRIVSIDDQSKYRPTLKNTEAAGDAL